MKTPKSLRILLALGITASLALAPALAQKQRLSAHPGYVDGTVLSDLIPDDIEGVEITEVNLAGPLLDGLSSALNQENEELRTVVTQLRGVTAVIASGLDEATTKRARDFVTDLSARLQSEGWERLVRVREKGARTFVFLHYAGEAVDGLTLLSYEGNEVTFVNIAGLIDLGTLSDLGQRVGVEGLGELAEQSGE